MAYIDYIPAEEWALDSDNILRIHGVNPPILRAHYQIYQATMFGPSPLSRRERELIAVTVSLKNKCHY